MYELAALRLPKFLNDQKPEDVYIPGWRPDLSAIKDGFIRGILEKIFVLDPTKRPTARELAELFQIPKSQVEEKDRMSSSLEVDFEFMFPANRSNAAYQGTQTLPVGALAKKSVKGQLSNPLIHAIIAGDIERVRAHISCKDTRDGNGDTPLMIAAKIGRKDIVEIIDPVDENGVTPLMRAAIQGDIGVARLLTPLYKGMRAAGSVKIESWNVHKLTALMGAAFYGHTEIVKLLIEHEGGIRDGDNQTALMIAARANCPECVKLLLDKEARMQENNQLTALIIATQKNNLECVKLLLNREAGMQEKTGCTALMQAVKNSSIECIKLLAEKEKNITNKNGQTALSIAKKNGNRNIISILSGVYGYW